MDDRGPGREARCLQQTGEQGRLWGRGQGDSPERTRHVSYSKVPHRDLNQKEEIQKMDRSNIQRNNGQGFSKTEEKSLPTD